MAFKAVLDWETSITVLNVFVSMSENIILNGVGAITQPCLTPSGTSNVSEYPPSGISACIPSEIAAPHTMAMNLSGQPNFDIFPKAVKTDYVQWVGEVDKGDIEVFILF